MAENSIADGYVAYHTEPSEARGSMPILLPTLLAGELYGERRKRASEAEAQSLAEELRTRADARSSAQLRPAPTSPYADDDHTAAIIRSFDRIIDRRNPTSAHPVLRGQELIRVAARVLTMRDKDYQKRELQVIDNLCEMGPLRAVINPGFKAKRWAEALSSLRHSHPHFVEVTDFVAGQVTLSVHSEEALSIPPMHLWGAPGLGKTHYANDLAEALGVPIRRQSMENAQTTSLLLGTERHWSTATSGIIFDQVVLGEVANPLFLIDELDKTPREGRYDPLMAFHSLLEPQTAAHVRDAAMDITFDASLAIYVATSNDPAKVPETLRSRMREFHIHPPRGEQALQAAKVIVRSAIAQLGVREFAEPDERIAYHVAHLTAREIKQTIRDAAARALEHDRLHLTLADLPVDPGSDGGPTHRTLH